MDVVLVDRKTADDWIHAPFSGYYDGDYIWGRGSIDNKSGLMSIMIAMDTLLEQGFRPQRTVALSFGFDEEASGELVHRRTSRCWKPCADRRVLP